MEAITPFLGRWTLIPERATYEFGDPPLAALYQISQNEKALIFNVLWKDSQGLDHKMSYAEIFDGQYHDQPEGGFADQIRLRISDDGDLVSEAMKGDDLVLRAQRKLVSSVEMQVTTSGKTPDGEDYTNVSVYKKEHRVSKMDQVRHIRRDAVAQKISLKNELQQVAMTIADLFTLYMAPEPPDGIFLGPSIDEEDPDETVYKEGDLTFSIQVRFGTKDAVSIYDANYAYQSHLNKLADGTWNFNVLQQNYHLPQISPETLEPIFIKMFEHMQTVAAGEQEKVDEVRRMGFKLS